MPYGVSSPHRAGRSVSMAELLTDAQVPFRSGPHPNCDEYVLAIDIEFWDQSKLFLHIGTFYSPLEIQDLLRNLRYYYPRVPLRIAFTV